MPRATAGKDTQRFELESLPEGYVELRKMSYGEVLRRRDLSTKVTGSTGRDVEIGMNNVEVQAYEFSTCIVDHNLDDGNGRKLNFSNKADVVSLDPIVAQEIEKHIGSLNELPEGSKSN